MNKETKVVKLESKALLNVGRINFVDISKKTCLSFYIICTLCIIHAASNFSNDIRIRHLCHRLLWVYKLTLKRTQIWTKKIIKIV